MQENVHRTKAEASRWFEALWVSTEVVLEKKCHLKDIDELWNSIGLSCQFFKLLHLLLTQWSFLHLLVHMQTPREREHELEVSLISSVEVCRCSLTGSPGCCYASRNSFCSFVCQFGLPGTVCIELFIMGSNNNKNFSFVRDSDTRHVKLPRCCARCRFIAF